MIAVIEVSGHQYVVKSGDIIEVDNQNKEIGDTLSVSGTVSGDTITI